MKRSNTADSHQVTWINSRFTVGNDEFTVNQSWDDVTEDVPFRHIVRETITRLKQSDHSLGQWCASGQDINVWVDANSLATGVLLKHDDVLENACWLRPAYQPKRTIRQKNRVFANSPGGQGFNPRSSHIKDSKNGTWFCFA